MYYPMHSSIGEFIALESIQQGSSFKRRVVFRPSIHIEETRTVAGDEIGGAEHRPEAEQSKQWQRLGRKRYAHRFEVPLALLHEHDWNSIAIGSIGSGDQFLRFGGTCDWILPEEQCWCPRVL